MLLSFVSLGATMSKFLTIAATTTLSIICAKFCPAHDLDPIPNGIMYCDILPSSSCEPGLPATSHRSGRKASGEGKTDGSRCIDQACVATTVPGGRPYPMISKDSVEPFLELVAVTTRSRRLGAAA